ncbi:unnamed protein product, partial [Dovyalis caffra]
PPATTFSLSHRPLFSLRLASDLPLQQTQVSSISLSFLFSGGGHSPRSPSTASPALSPSFYVISLRPRPISITPRVFSRQRLPPQQRLKKAAIVTAGCHNTR